MRLLEAAEVKPFGTAIQQAILEISKRIAAELPRRALPKGVLGFAFSQNKG